MEILDNNIISCTMNNGYWSNWFEITKGCRQGCSFSALKFLVTIEILGIKLRTNVKIKGVDMENYELRNIHYANNLWLALDPMNANIDEVLKELNDFETFSGLTINYEKSIAVKIGPHRDTDAKYYTMKKLFWSFLYKILGIQMNPDWRKMHEENYGSTLKKITAILHQWQNRNLLIMGKVAIITSLIASLLTYKLACLPSPDRIFMKEYRKIVTNFIWNNGLPRFKYDKLVLNRKLKWITINRY